MTEEQKNLLDSLGTHEITTYLRNDRNTAFILWQTEDVVGKANEMGFEISEEEAEDIISNIDNSSDCEYGITWETIRHHINEWIEENTFEVIIIRRRKYT